MVVAENKTLPEDCSLHPRSSASQLKETQGRGTVSRRIHNYASVRATTGRATANSLHSEGRRKDLQARIADCDFDYASFKQDGKLAEALDVLERCMFLRRDRDGGHSAEVERTAEAFVKDCNTVAMTSLKTGNFILCFELLKKADIITGEGGLVRKESLRLRLRAITLNNFGCFYRKRGKLHSALQSLDKALRIELTSKHVDNPAATHMNLCVVLSQLGKHRAALEHAMCAIDVLKSAIDPRSILGMVTKSEARDPSLLAMALHNAAIESQHLGDHESASHLLLKAAETAESGWGQEDPRAHSIRRAYMESLGEDAETDDDDDDEVARAGHEKSGDDEPGETRVREGGQAGAQDESAAGNDGKLLSIEKARGSGRRKTKAVRTKTRSRRADLKELMLSEPVGFELPPTALPPLRPLSPSLHGASPTADRSAGMGPHQSPTLKTKGANGDEGTARVKFDRRVATDDEHDLKPAAPGGEGKGGMSATTLQRWVLDGLEALAGEGLGVRDEDVQERMRGLEGRAEQFLQLLQGDGGDDVLSEIRKGPSKLRCKLTGPSFERRLLVLHRDPTLAELRKEIETLLEIRTEFWVRYIDEDGDRIRLTDDSTLRNALLDSQQRGGAVPLEVYTRLDKERAEAEEARAKAQKEREEAEAAEAKARKEREEAEEAERLAREAAEQAAHAERELQREEEEARQAEAAAEERRVQRDAAEHRWEAAEREVAQLQDRLAQLSASSQTGTDAEEEGGEVSEAREALEAARERAREGSRELASRREEYGAAVREAEREREEAKEAKAEADRGMQAALAAERVAVKERAEADDAAREAERERQEAEDAERVMREEEKEYELARLASEEGTNRHGAEQVEAAEDQAVDWGPSRGLSRGQAMVRIAGALRCKWARRELKSRRQVMMAMLRKNASKQIQRMYRGLHARKRCSRLRARMEEERLGREATTMQRYVRGFLARIRVQGLRVSAAKESLFLARYALDGVQAGEETVKAGARGALRRVQAREQLLHLHDLAGGSGRHQASDTKRAPRHAFHRVLVRVERDAARHLREVQALRSLASGERYSLRPDGPRRGDLQFVSLALDHSMNIACHGPPLHCLVLPMPEGTLYEHMHTVRGRGAEPEVLSMLYQMIRAVDFLHQAGYCHCNLSAHSFVLLNGRWLLGELSDARLLNTPLDPDSPSVKALLAPEAILLVEGEEDELLAHPSLDFFLVGLLMFEAFVGRPLFKHYRDAVRQVEDDEIVIGTGRCKEQVAKYVLENTLCKHPQDRFTAKDLLIMLPQIGDPALITQDSRSSNRQILEYLKAGGGEAGYVGGEDETRSVEDSG